jgi:hypothetical protein
MTIFFEMEPQTEAILHHKYFLIMLYVQPKENKYVREYVLHNSLIKRKPVASNSYFF